MSARIRRLTLILAITLGVAALVAGFVVREPIERKLFLDRLERETGLLVDVDRLQRSADGYVVSGFRAHSRGGAIAVEAPRARIAERGANLDLAFDGASVTLAPQRLRGDEFAAIAPSQASDRRVAVTLANGRITIVAGDVPIPLMTFDEFVMNANLEATSSRYVASANLVDGSRRYPLESHCDTPASGPATCRLSAVAVPLHSFAPLFADYGGNGPVDGWLRDIDLHDGASPRATLRLDNVSFQLGAHVLAGLHGALTAQGDGVGSRSIAGTLDGSVPFEAAGEVHDIAPHFAWLYSGSKDLLSVASLTSAIASEPRVRSVRVEATAPGLMFGQYGIATDHGPLAISLLSMDPQERTLRFDTAIAEDHVISGGERTSAMGLRTGAVGGVNGDYFDIGRTYQPQGMLVENGALVRGPTDRAALTIDRNNNVRFAEFHMHGMVRTQHGTMPVTEFNDWPPGYVSIITPAYGRTLRGAGDATFVALEADGRVATRYRVTKVVAPGGAPDVSFGIAIGARVRAPLPKIGETVDVSFATEPSIAGAVAAIGGGPILLRDGAWYEDPHAPAPDERGYRWPVIALARQPGGRLMLVAVDGRHPERSVGATRPEFAAILQRLGAADAMALDSGGSVTLVARAPGDANVSVRNVPSDNSAERWISDGLFLYSSAPPPSIVVPSEAPTPVPEARPSP